MKNVSEAFTTFGAIDEVLTLRLSSGRLEFFSALR
jgi:hypothetical protein